MKFSIEGKELASALNRVIGTVPKRAAMAILSNIKITVDGLQLRLTASDMNVRTETVVDAEIEKGGKVLLPAQQLYNTVTALSNATLKVSISDSFRATITTDNAKYQIQGMDVGEYPEPPTTGESLASFTMPVTRLRPLVETVNYAVSGDEFRPAMTGVFLQVLPHSVRMVATDGFRLSTRKEVFIEAIINEEVAGVLDIDPLKETLKRVRDENVSIILSRSHAVISDSITTSTMRLIEEAYPNWESVIPKENTNILIIRRDDLLNTLKRVLLYSNGETKQVKITLAQETDTLVVMADDVKTGGEAKESIPMQYKGEAMSVGLNGVLWKDALNHIESDEVEIQMSTPLRPLLLHPTNRSEDCEYFHLLMPVRIGG